MPNLQGRYAPLGFGQWEITSSAAKGLTAGEAAGTNTTEVSGDAAILRAEIVPEVAIRFRCDGTDPTTTRGTPLAANAQYELTSDVTRFRFIATAATGNVNVEFFGA